jgi:cell division septation protein DedD
MIAQVLQKAKKMRHLNKKTNAEETNTVKIVVISVAVIITSLFLFSMNNIIHYFVLKKTLTESLHMKSPTLIQQEDLSQQVKPQGLLLPKEAVSPTKMEDTRKEIKEKYSPFQKPSKAKFTIQVGAFSNPQYAKALATRLDEKGYKVYINPLEEKDERLFRVRVGNFSNRQQAERISKKIMKNEYLETFIALH